MFSQLLIFAGPICINPNTERESFVWALVIGGFLLGVLTILFGFAALIIKIRNTFNVRRKNWVKKYCLSLLAFLLMIGFGWLVATGGSANDYCRTAQSSIQGSFFMGLAGLAGLAAFVSLLGFIFSFSDTRKK